MTTSALGPVGPTAEVCLRPYQQQAIESLDAKLAAGVRRIVIVAPTGAGKTVIAGSIISNAARRGSSVLFLAHRRELINQSYKKLLDFGLPEAGVGVIMAGDSRRRPAAIVQIASVDTLRNRPKPLADVVFVDECHRATAPSYQTIASYYPNAVHLGLTATPYRADGKGLCDAYDDLLVVASPSQLIADGYLVAPRIFTVPPSAMPDLSAVKVRGGDYDEKTLSEAVDRKSLVGNIVDHWLAHARGVRTVVFAVSVAHSKHVAERFKEAGIVAEHLDGMTPNEERDGILGRLERGETQVVSSVGVLAEGWDQPAVKCAILARPTKSTGLYLQQAGRILRPFNGQSAVILDHAGCYREHGCPQDDREFSLEGKKKQAASEAQSPQERECPECCAVVPISCSVCPECGNRLIEKVDVLEESPEQLVEVSPDESKHAVFNELCQEAARCGYKPGWVYHRFKDRFGHAPSWKIPQIVSGPQPTRLAVDAIVHRLHGGGPQLTWNDIDAVQNAKRAVGE